MRTIGAVLDAVGAGSVEIVVPYDLKLTQQHGFLHGGIVAAVLDSACGYAALSTMTPDAGILTIEFKVNLLAPAEGDRFRFVGTVVKPGRTITVSDGAAFALRDGAEKKIATMTATLMAIHGRANIRD
ncbi:PaaI family thioesterase [Oricola cellulosilytica]|uniref:Medium/long-chain acyl-CoA thioesterase YigI n=2 Tax=Oricola cellulosilytica TaxID=1429082 RepID=A0A4R0PB33_9HYPH|nr:PaaI family thioesterase [Oricola cellulosilytica]